MRPTQNPFVPFACILPLLGSALSAQDPVETPPAEAKPDAASPESPGPRGPGGRRQGRPRQRTVAVLAGHVHPVSGPSFENGVVLIRGDRIVAVGKQGEVEVPEGAETVSFPEGHVYPGLIDASSDAFLDDGVRQDPSADAATSAGTGFGQRFDREDRLIEAGITTVYTSNQRGAPWSGIGAVLRPKKGGASAFPEKTEAGVGMQLAAGPTGTHALDRQRGIEGAFGVFSGLDDYKKKQDEHKKALEKYTKEFADYLAWHEKKNGKSSDEKKDAPKDGEQKPAGAAAEAPAQAGGAGAPRGPGQRGSRRGGQPQGPGGGGPGGGPTPTPTPEEPKPEQPKPDQPKPQDPPKPETPKPDQPKPDQPKPETPKPQDPPKQEPKPAEPAAPKAAEAKPQEPKPADAKAAEGKPDEKAPERPKYPKAPDRDPVKETLLKVLDGTLPLRITVRRPDEIRAALAAAREKKVPALVIDDALGAGAVASELADAAVPVVLTGLFPVALPESYEKLQPFDAPKTLQDKGVPFAIASGSGRRARALPLMAAAAVGHGLSPDAALRAITLTPAEILGVQKDVGSLQAGKLADLVVCDRPILQSDCRMLAVWSAGALQHEGTETKKETR
jgi:imidazolonepropionase-like amidohydrolase